MKGMQHRISWNEVMKMCAQKLNKIIMTVRIKNDGEDLMIMVS